MQQKDPPQRAVFLSIKFCVNPAVFMLKLDTDDINSALQL